MMKIILLLPCSWVVIAAGSARRVEGDEAADHHDALLEQRRDLLQNSNTNTGYTFDTPDVGFETMEAATTNTTSTSAAGTSIETNTTTTSTTNTKTGVFRFPSPAPISFEDYEEEIRAEINEEDFDTISPRLDDGQKKDNQATTHQAIHNNASDATFSPTPEESQDPSEEPEFLEDWITDFLSETPSDTVLVSDSPSNIPSDLPSMIPSSSPLKTNPPNVPTIPVSLSPAAQVHFSAHYYYFYY